MRDLGKGDLIPRSALGEFFGGLTCLFLGGSLLALAGTAFVTLFFMKAGGASGARLLIVLVFVPFAWLLSECLFALCYAHQEKE